MPSSLDRAARPKSALLTELGLELAEQWWVRELAPGPGGPATTSGSIAGGATDAGQVSTDAPASGVTVPSSAGSTPAAMPRPQQRSRPRFEVPRRIDGPGFSAVFGLAPPAYDPGGPVLLADDVADGTDAASLVAEAIRLGAVLLVVPAIPGTARARECPDPVGRWLRIGMSVGLFLIVAE